MKKSTKIEVSLFEKLVTMVQLVKCEGMNVPAAFLEELIDACVLEFYFLDSLTAGVVTYSQATKELHFSDQVAALLKTQSRREFRLGRDSAPRRELFISAFPSCCHLFLTIEFIL